MTMQSFCAAYGNSVSAGVLYPKLREMSPIIIVKNRMDGDFEYHFLHFQYFEN